MTATKKKSKNQIRLENNQAQIGRHIGTTRAKKPITKYEYEKLMKFVSSTPHLKQHRARIKLKRLFTLLYITGCRISEVIDFSKKDLDLMIKCKEYSLKNNTKMKKPRLIVLSDNQLEVIKTIVPKSPGRLFDVTTAYITIKANDIIHKCLGDLYSTHSFRTGYVTRLSKNGESIKLIQEDIGHKSVTTTSRYIKVTDDDKRIAKEKLVW